ncbi:MAG: hypothetical protein L0H84_03280 [Pseudonocardia sp.]|nr:hypothetical protein [Pseudonocardia sp.]
MSVYQLNRCVYDWVRAGEVDGGSSGRAGFDDSAYELTDVERAAFATRDVAGLYRLGLHQVLLNRFCRAAGLARDDYRKLLEPLGQAAEGKGRWQR